jgi:hypothetical protein
MGRVAIFGIAEGRMACVRFHLEPVEEISGDLAATVLTSLGHQLYERTANPGGSARSQDGWPPNAASSGVRVLRIARRVPAAPANTARGRASHGATKVRRAPTGRGPRLHPLSANMQSSAPVDRL